MHKPEAYEVFHHPFLLKIDIFCKTPKEALEKKKQKKSREQQVPVDER